MSEQEQTRYFVDLDWTVRVRRFKGRRSGEWLTSINVSAIRGRDVSSVEMSPERATNLIRLLNKAIVRGNAWEEEEKVKR